MISFTASGEAEVHFDIVGSLFLETRCEVRMPLEVWVSMAKAANTVEELRVMVFNYERFPAAKTAKV